MDKRPNSETNSLTVLFESGYGDGADVWSELQDDIAEKYATISYDRAGVENSDKSPNRRTVVNQVKELHALLEKIDSKGPYLIVAHSIGGLNSRMFASEYPEDVKGIVFVDSTHEDVCKKLLQAMTPERRELFLNSPVYEGNFDEKQESCDEVRKARENNDILRNIPIVVLTVSEHGLSNVWLELQNDLVSLSNYSKHVMVDKCGHYIQEDKPEIVKDAIFEVAEKIKNIN